MTSDVKDPASNRGDPVEEEAQVRIDPGDYVVFRRERVEEARISSSHVS